MLGRGGGNATASGVDFQAKLGAWFAAQMLFARSGPVEFLSHLRSLRRYDAQEIPHFWLTPICLMNADAGHLWADAVWRLKHPNSFPQLSHISEP